MALLKDLTIKDFNGVATAPIIAYVIKAYMATDKLLNVLPFTNEGALVGTSLVYNAQVWENGLEATARAIGEEPAATVETPSTVPIYLKSIAKEYAVDSILQEAYKNNSNEFNKWEASQIALSVDAVKRLFTRNFISSAVAQNDADDKNTTGLAAYFNANPGQVMAAFDLSAGISEAIALKFENYFNEAIAHLNGDPSKYVLVTTKLKGAPLFRTLENYRHRALQVINVGDVAYDTVFGMKMVALDDKYFGADATASTVPFYVLYLDEVNGIRVITPNIGNVIKVTTAVQNGVFVRNGGVEIISNNVMVNPDVAVKGSFTLTA